MVSTSVHSESGLIKEVTFGRRDFSKTTDNIGKNDNDENKIDSRKKRKGQACWILLSIWMIPSNFLYE